MRHDPGLHEGPVFGINWKWRGVDNHLPPSSEGLEDTNPGKSPRLASLD
jgi:hypothetical protein